MKFNIKLLSILVLIDFVALGLFFYFTKYVIQTVREYYQIIQNLTPDIDKYGLVLQQNASLLDMNILGENLSTVSQISNKILFLFLLLVVVSFLLYNISQSVNWNLLLNEFKFRNYKNYLKNFTLINIPGFLILIYLGFKIITRLRSFILDFWFESYFNTREFFVILLLILLSLIIIFIKFEFYKLINKHSLKEALYLVTNKLHKEYWNFVLFLIAIFISVFLFIVLLRINPESVISIVVASLVSLGIFNKFRIYFSKN